VHGPGAVRATDYINLMAAREGRELFYRAA
jgi:hypothetical protein